MNRPILRLPDMTKDFILRTDASDQAVGAVLLQECCDELFPVAFASKKFTEREKRYSTMEKECLALVWAVKMFHGIPVRQYFHSPNKPSATRVPGQV